MYQVRSDPLSVVVFLEKLETYKALPASHVAKLDELYGLNKTENVEIRLRFYLIALKSGPEYSKSAAGEWTVVPDPRQLRFCD